ncbi:hypothetical protein ACFFGR_20790 [Arthrobacter liuii]|uniref:hypothetical protein n=1 Tax=Arthrobacter liuii TaxID=1476996 RepID=UPI00166F216A|nr:hypothetical protein [Arthrobacter liuii]
MERGLASRIPRPYGGSLIGKGAVAYRRAGEGLDPRRTVSVPLIGSYPLLAAWAGLNGLRLDGRDTLHAIEAAIGEGGIDVDGPIMLEVGYFLGDTLCQEYEGWEWNIDASGLPVLVFDREHPANALVWNVFSFLRKKTGPGPLTLAEALDRMGADSVERRHR